MDSRDKIRKIRDLGAEKEINITLMSSI